MKKNHLQLGLLIFTLIGCFSCSYSVEPMSSLSSPFKRVNYVLANEENDIYSAHAVLENEPIVLDKRGLPVGVPLFAKSSKAISYLLNGQPTRDRKAVKAIFERAALDHNYPPMVKEILVQENKVSGQKLVVINYEE